MDGQMQSCRKRVRDDESNELELQMAAVKRLRDDLLGVFDDSDPELAGQDPDSAGRDLDSVIRSFQDEISAASTSASSSAGGIDLTSDSSESRSELGYLLEASDDELGLPRASEDEVAELAPVPSNSSGIGELWGFESFDDQIPSYESFESGGPGGEYVVFDDGLFGFSGGCFDPSEVADYS